MQNDLNFMGVINIQFVITVIWPISPHSNHFQKIIPLLIFHIKVLNLYSVHARVVASDAINISLVSNAIETTVTIAKIRSEDFRQILINSDLPVLCDSTLLR